jgi:hypothetical protein
MKVKFSIFDNLQKYLGYYVSHYNYTRIALIIGIKKSEYLCLPLNGEWRKASLNFLDWKSGWHLPLNCIKEIFSPFEVPKDLLEE